MAKKTTSITRRFLIFSIIFFLVVLLGGTGAFFFSMRQIVHNTASQELIRLLETERMRLEEGVNAEIAVVVKMANSPLLGRYFRNPDNPELESLAFEEMAGYRDAFQSNTVFWVNNVDKRFYSDDAYVYTINPDDPAEYWYKMTLYETEIFNFNINYNDSLKKTMLWINAPVFVNQQAIGVVGTGIDLTVFIDSIYGNLGRDSDEEGLSQVQLYLFNEENEITGAADAALIEQKKTITDLVSDGSRIAETAQGLEPDGIETFVMGSAQYAVGRIPRLNWYITAFVPITPAMYLQSSMTVIFFMMILVIFLIFVVINIFIRSTLKPLDGMMRILGEVSERWDLTKRITINRSDEIGALAEFFNKTFDKMKDLIATIKQQTVSLFDIGSELAYNMTATAAAINKIVSHIQSIKGRVIHQSASITETNATMEQITGNIGQLNRNIEKQTVSMSRSSSAIEEMLANIQSVTQTLVKNADHVHSLADASDIGRQGLQEVVADIQEIARESAGLLEINAVMENIASQTNLLSMNAAIEAAHAGEAGKGFAVVAGEIRKLAESSSNQSKTVSAVLKKIKESIDKITTSTENVLNKFEAIDSGIKTVADQEENIRNAMEEQGEGSRQILESTGELNEVTSIVKNGSGEMLEGSRQIITEGRNLQMMTAEITNGINEMVAGADQINVAVVEVNDLSSRNRDNIDILVKEIARFKVE
ncbi:MAG: methyl-accepting chemotaxis protein [Treponema sp.]|jgi:methyl-accepting chemotaxis protein|nr:methyl-accepting chemotaxis protein [Treponema sp.]